MAHFAQLNEHNAVAQVIVIANEVVGEPFLSFPETEPHGQRFIFDVLGLPGEWRQTSYNASFRGKYAGIGDMWDGTNFISPVVEE
jgi:hypothetical protein